MYIIYTLLLLLYNLYVFIIAVIPDLILYGSLHLDGGSGGHGNLFIGGYHYQPICDHTFGMKEGDVACREMGYTRAVGVQKNSL